MVAVLFATFIYVLDQVNVTRFMASPRSPEVLHDRAEELLRTFGVETSGTPVSELSRKTAYLLWPGSAKAMRKGPAPFTYRLMYGIGPDDFTDAMIAGAGRTTVEIDPHGRLTFLLSAPPSGWKERTLDPNAVLRAAGLDPASLKPARSRFAPPAPFDSFTAWSGSYPGDTTPVRAELATWHGTPTFFRVTGAWDDAAPRELAFENREVVIYVHIVGILLIAGGLVMARRNLRLRRGDRQGAWRLAMAVFLIQLVAGFLIRGLSSDLLESANIAKRTVSGALLGAAIAYLFYIAIEPLVRRRWPAQLISWSRLLAGRWRDPMVGRDVLIGVIGGFMHSLMGAGGGLLIARASGGEPAVNVESIGMITGLRPILFRLFDGVTSGVAQAFAVMAVLALLTALVRKRAIAVAGLFAIYLTGFLFATGGELQFLPLVVPIAVMLVFIAVRYGLLAYAVTMMVFFWIFFLPYMPVRWAMPMLLVPLVATALLAVWAFYTSLGGQSPVSASMLDE